MERRFLLLAGINGFLAVALGAFGAHGLRSALARATDGLRRIEVWETGARYQIYHALALWFVSSLCARTSSSLPSVAGYLFQAGIVLFSGSLYILALSGVRALGAITPLGGLCFLAGWATVIVCAVKN